MSSQSARGQAETTPEAQTLTEQKPFVIRFGGRRFIFPRGRDQTTQETHTTQAQQQQAPHAANAAANGERQARPKPLPRWKTTTPKRQPRTVIKLKRRPAPTASREHLLSEWTRRLSKQTAVADLRLRMRRLPAAMRRLVGEKRWQERSRLAIFAVVTPLERLQIFDAVAPSLWQSTSRDSVWRTILGLMSDMDVPIAASDRKMAKMLRKRAVPVNALANPAGEEQRDCTEKDVAAIAAATADKHVRAAIALAFRLGQRPSDIAQLCSEGVGRITLDGVPFVTVTFLRGKTVNGEPFSLHLPAGIVEAQWLEEVAREAVGAKQPLFGANSGSPMVRPIFLADFESDTLAAFSKELLKTMRHTRPGIQARQLRRGGLQTLALCGLTAAQLLNYSCHRSEKTLQRYLGHGRWFAEAARSTADVVAKTLVHFSLPLDQ